MNENLTFSVCSKCASRKFRNFGIVGKKLIICLGPLLRRPWLRTWLTCDGMKKPVEGRAVSIVLRELGFFTTTWTEARVELSSFR